MISLYEAKYEKNKSKNEKELIRNRRFLHTGEEEGEDLSDVMRSTSPEDLTAMRRDNHEIERGQKNFPAKGNRPTKMSRALMSRYKDGRLQNLRRAKINRRLSSGLYYSDSPENAESENSIRRYQRENYEFLMNYILSEGYADSYRSAYDLLQNLSEEWISSLI